MSSQLILMGWNPVTKTYFPVTTAQNGGIIFTTYANSGEQQDTAIAADYVIGNASGEQAIAASAVPNTVLYSNPIKTNHATSLILTAYLSQAVAAGSVYTLGVQAVEVITGHTNYRSLAFGTSPDFATNVTGWCGAYAMVTRNDLTTGGNINLSKTILPPYIRFSLTVPNKAGTTAGTFHYSLCR